MILRSIHIGILSLLLGSVSAADAQVMTVAVAPSPAIPGQSATVTVTGGSAPCGAVEINYGDGMTSTYPIPALPLVQPHTWNTVGNKTVVVTGLGNCTGQAAVTVGVLRSTPALPERRVNKTAPPKFSVLIRIKIAFRLEPARGVCGDRWRELRGTTGHGRRQA